MLMPVMDIRPVGMIVDQFRVSMLMSMRLPDRSFMRVLMMLIVMPVCMGMSQHLMMMGMLMFFFQDRPNSYCHQGDGREHNPAQPFAENDD
jgi:uncharacterized membrane protein YhaH (DUF805 family)